MIKSGIIDPTKVTRYAQQNAAMPPGGGMRGMY
jgi:chaperonin GroEL (HSP60 family)